MISGNAGTKKLKLIGDHNLPFTVSPALAANEMDGDDEMRPFLSEMRYSRITTRHYAPLAVIQGAA